MGCEAASCKQNNSETPLSRDAILRRVPAPFRVPPGTRCRPYRPRPPPPFPCKRFGQGHVVRKVCQEGAADARPPPPLSRARRRSAASLGTHPLPWPFPSAPLARPLVPPARAPLPPPPPLDAPAFASSVYLASPKRRHLAAASTAWDPPGDPGTAVPPPSAA